MQGCKLLQPRLAKAVFDRGRGAQDRRRYYSKIYSQLAMVGTDTYLSNGTGMNLERNKNGMFATSTKLVFFYTNGMRKGNMVR